MDKFCRYNNSKPTKQWNVIMEKVRGFEWRWGMDKDCPFGIYYKGFISVGIIIILLPIIGQWHFIPDNNNTIRTPTPSTYNNSSWAHIWLALAPVTSIRLEWNQWIWVSTTHQSIIESNCCLRIFKGRLYYYST